MLNEDCTNVKNSFFQSRNISIILLSDHPNDKNLYQADTFIDYQDNQNIIIDKVQHIIHQKIELVPTKQKSNETLSAREKNILKHIALGLTNKEIADQLFISIHTVVTHRKNITQKLGIKSVSGLTVYAILNNLISMDEVK
ncbi:DNA-binding response regulator [Ancylomarina longa]|uniref:DNA-binding response regulator n=2 Tax=Ancylomarina longa TaxID=2487017 RepID=A0A434AGC7_9BACT|nr:DNA-binding response regulator [Ancylomarina longa]